MQQTPLKTAFYQNRSTVSHDAELGRLFLRVLNLTQKVRADAIPQKLFTRFASLITLATGVSAWTSLFC